ncbi:MAG: serine/threonine protein kinase [Polyangiaceae bacterium]|nr:serine/threonine protein kinase [Polyangiaceae bacterium]
MAPKGDLHERARVRVGTVLKGKWLLDSVLGIGATACVYGATHRNQSRVAIKMLHPEIAGALEVTARFLREGYVANAVQHPGTVLVLDDDITEDGAPFLVMERLTGETLEARLRRLGRLSPLEVATIADQLLDVLQAAHARGIVHRDLKPDNLFLTDEGRIKVLDFGIARLREVSSRSTNATQDGTLLGTPAFMAPEQALGHWSEVDTRTDIWSAGATLFTLLSGRFVHEGCTVPEQLVLTATRPAPPLRSVAPEIAVELASVIDQALSFAKVDRWPDARAMQEALRAVAPAGIESSVPLEVVAGVAPGGEPAVTNRTEPHVLTRSATPDPPRRGHGLRFVAVATVAAVAIGWFALGGWRAFATAHPVPPHVESARLASPGEPPVVVSATPVPGPIDLDSDVEVSAPGTESASPTASAKPVAVDSASRRTRVRVRRAPPRTDPAAPPAPTATEPASDDRNPFDLRH